MQMAKQEQLDQTFNFKRLNESSKVLVSNSLSYLMAEYDDNTGVTRWIRVANASQREQVENWLKSHYPAKTQTTTTPTPKQKRAA